MEEPTKRTAVDAILSAYTRDFGVGPSAAIIKLFRQVDSQQWQKSHDAGYAPRWFSEDGVKKFIWY